MIVVCLEGLDGSGKSTHARILVESLWERGYRAVLTREPTDGVVGGFIRELLSRPGYERFFGSCASANLFAADMWLHWQEINRYLEQGLVVVMDRCKYSTAAYQSVHCPIDYVMRVVGYIPPPHVLIYLEVDLDTALARLKDRKGRQVTEHRWFLEKVLRNYELVLGVLPRIDRERFGRPLEVVRIRTDREVEEVHREVLGVVLRVLQGLRSPL